MMNRRYSTASRRYIETRGDWEDNRLLKSKMKRIVRDARTRYFPSTLGNNVRGIDIWKLYVKGPVYRESITSASDPSAI